ncbi:DUF1003 domain-containing protein [Candidatus Parcubacteria bacterium]|nr:DUF1003 domain-containing protein [Candidatus Parcubacteria bacterium]
MTVEYKHKLPSLEELKASRRPVRGVIKDTHVALSPLEEFAVFITHHVGSMGFFLVLFIWTLGWLLWNLLAPHEFRFDPAPAFVVWLFISNMIQLILLPLIMVGQNLESRFADMRAEADFHINEKAEKEIETVIAHLENQNELLLEILKKTEKS